MAYTVAASFDKFRENIEPEGYDRVKATARRDDLVKILSKNFTIVDSFPTGSLPKYTAVKDFADLDVFVVLHYGKHIKGKKPSEVLQAVRDSLGEYKTNVRKNGQAVTLHYKTWPKVDIVPVFFTEDSSGGVAYYNVPDMDDESWTPSKPTEHLDALSVRNDAYGIEFKRIIKMIKWWNHKHGEYLESYHIEVLALHALVGSFTTYPWEIYYFFSEAAKLLVKPLWHDLAYVDEYLGANARQLAVDRLVTARDKAYDAWYLTYGQSTDHAGAIGIWRQIFGDEFPPYG